LGPVQHPSDNSEKGISMSQLPRNIGLSLAIVIGLTCSIIHFLVQDGSAQTETQVSSSNTPAASAPVKDNPSAASPLGARVPIANALGSQATTTPLTSGALLQSLESNSISEIEAIRKRIGVSALAGLPAPPDPAEFRRALEQAALKQQKPAPQTASAAVVLQPGIEVTASTDASPRTAATKPAGDPASVTPASNIRTADAPVAKSQLTASGSKTTENSSPADSTHSSDLRTTLTEAVRLLETQADLSEAKQAYEESDRLRALAHEIRRELRSL
jgi:hypothetical protein